jgi:uncharacterized protein
MKKKILLLLLLSSVLTTVDAQAPAGNEENSLLWKISGKGLKYASYLYGTIHVIPKKDFFITDSTLFALNQAESVAFEFNLKKEMRLLPQLLLMSKMKMKGDTTLEMLLSEEDFAFLRTRLEERRIPLRLINRMKPSLISDLVSGDIAESMKKNESTSYEMEFLKRAKAADKNIAGLETAAYQMSVFDSIPYTAQAQMLVQELRSDGSESGKEYKKLLKLYKRQDLLNLGRAIGANDELSSYNDILLFHRNRNWIPVIEKMSAKRKMFYAVGAGHLVGEKGVISLLRKRGYVLTPVH